MGPKHFSRRYSVPFAIWCICWAAEAADVSGQAPVSVKAIIDFSGVVEVMPAGQTAWSPASKGQLLKPGDRVRTREHSRLVLRLSDNDTARLHDISNFQIQPPTPVKKNSSLNLQQGMLYLFHRGKPAEFEMQMRTVSAAIRGTEFNVEVQPNERTILTMIDGTVELSNGQNPVTVTSHQQGIVEPGQAPTVSPMLEVNTVIQWCFYYPGVLDPAEIGLGAQEAQILSDSLTAYREGDLVQALAAYPAGRQPAGTAERVYLAGILLAAGQVEQTKALLSALGPGGNVPPGGMLPEKLADALREIIATVSGKDWSRAQPPQSASEWLAESYSQQSHSRLDEALKAARQAVERSPQFGFGWERVAELEFSFGRTGEALAALEKSLALAPRNAQAQALKGFVLAARNKISEATVSFERAITLDGSLGNAWLGHGLCRIRKGDTRGGREDLQVAATVEPQRAVLRSYLAKAYGNEGDYPRASKEIQLAKGLDINDPTAWFYSALINEQYSRINEAVRDLEQSQVRSDNRQVYRSRFLLDQDRAVRNANLARVYADADLGDVAVREAGRGVAADYANYSSHAFLANSYEVERRESLSTLRFEAASFSEYLIANLLGPANGRLLAQPVTQLEYSDLFERNRLGLIANTEYFSRGAWHHSSAQYGTLNGSSYSLEAEYRTDPGERANQDLEIRQLEAKVKQDITPNDSVYLHVIDFRANGGDTLHQFDQTNVSRTFRFDQEQTPTILAGYHHQWSPQNHTLVLAGRFDDTLQTSDPFSPVLVLDRPMGIVDALLPVTVAQDYRSRVELYSAEAQQIAVLGSQSLIAGARLQWSKQSVADRVANPSRDFGFTLGMKNPVSVQSEEVWSSSVAAYVYDYLRVADSFQIIGGLNFTHQSIPVNTATAPVSSQRDHQERVSPKAGFIWSPSPSSSIRAAYTKSLTGAGLGQSVRLEPTQVAGLLQTFRASVPFSLVGPLDGADLQTAELLWEGRFRDTYLSLGGQWLDAKRDRRLGLFLSDPNYDPGPTLALIQERVRFKEYAMDVSAHQLLSKEWSFGVQYRLAYAQLKRSFPEYPDLGFGGVEDGSNYQGWLHTLRLSALYRHRSGLFTRAESVFFAQDRRRLGHALQPDTLAPGDTTTSDKPSFWQVNGTVGYRFPKQRAEIAVGILNALGDDYRLDPVNQYPDLPRARTFYARLLLNF